MDTGNAAQMNDMSTSLEAIWDSCVVGTIPVLVHLCAVV